MNFFFKDLHRSEFCKTNLHPTLQNNYNFYMLEYLEMLFAFNEMKMSKLLVDSGMNMISSPVQADYPIFERTFNPNNFCHQRHILKILSV